MTSFASRSLFVPVLIAVVCLQGANTVVPVQSLSMNNTNGNGGDKTGEEKGDKKKTDDKEETKSPQGGEKGLDDLTESFQRQLKLDETESAGPMLRFLTEENRAKLQNAITGIINSVSHTKFDSIENQDSVEDVQDSIENQRSVENNKEETSVKIRNNPIRNNPLRNNPVEEQKHPVEVQKREHVQTKQDVHMQERIAFQGKTPTVQKKPTHHEIVGEEDRMRDREFLQRSPRTQMELWRSMEETRFKQEELRERQMEDEERKKFQLEEEKNVEIVEKSIETVKAAIKEWKKLSGEKDSSSDTEVGALERAVNEKMMNDKMMHKKGGGMGQMNLMQNQAPVKKSPKLKKKEELLANEKNKQAQAHNNVAQLMKEMTEITNELTNLQTQSSKEVAQTGNTQVGNHQSSTNQPSTNQASTNQSSSSTKSKKNKKKGKKGGDKQGQEKEEGGNGEKKQGEEEKKQASEGEENTKKKMKELESQKANLNMEIMKQMTLQSKAKKVVDDLQVQVNMLVNQLVANQAESASAQLTTNVHKELENLLKVASPHFAEVLDLFMEWGREHGAEQEIATPDKLVALIVNGGGAYSRSYDTAGNLRINLPWLEQVLLFFSKYPHLAVWNRSPHDTKALKWKVEMQDPEDWTPHFKELNSWFRWVAEAYSVIKKVGPKSCKQDCRSCASQRTRVTVLEGLIGKGKLI
jgi:hypothetical protein